MPISTGSFHLLDYCFPFRWVIYYYQKEKEKQNTHSKESKLKANQIIVWWINWNLQSLAKMWVLFGPIKVLASYFKKKNKNIS